MECWCRFESNCPLVGPGTIDGVPSLGVFLRHPSPLREFPRKTTEYSERIGQQARLGFEPGTSRLPVLSDTAVPLVGPPSYET